MRGDTIAAQATAPGEAGVAVIRISGPDAARVLSGCFRGRRSPVKHPRELVYGRILLDGETVDLGMAVYLPAPGSYTGEDSAELQCHGGQAVTARVLEAALRSGARMARRGEFSRRAFLNGKLDLTQAEAVMDLVAARTDRAAAQALHQLEGGLGRQLTAMEDGLLTLLAEMDVASDEPEEYNDPTAEGRWLAALTETETAMDRLLASAAQGRLLREGITCVLAGRPNVGKSSLMNMLLGENRAIVTPVAGTTRDTVEAVAELDGFAVTLVDTAGVRETRDPVEALGVERARKALAAADLVLLVLEAGAALTGEEKALLEEIGAVPHLLVINKTDLSDTLPVEAGERAVPVSAKTGAGMDALRAAMLRLLGCGGVTDGEVMLTRVRHRDAIRRAREALEEARAALASGEPSDLAAIGVRAACRELAEVTGRQVDEAVIDRIFEQFCLGK